MKKQISKCVKMLFLGIIMCLGMALSVHAEGSGQFFQFDGEKWNKEEFSWTDSQGQIWYAHEYGTNGEAIISAVTEAVMELQVPSYVYKDGVAKKVIESVSIFRIQNMITHGTGLAVSITMESMATERCIS